MSDFICVPYCPMSEVTLAVSGFEVKGIVSIAPPEMAALPTALSRHADLGLCPIGGNEVVCPPDSYAYYSDKLAPYGFSVICGGQPLGGSYPADTAYNVVVVGKYAFLNPKVCDALLLKRLEARFDIVPVKQGYAKCSVAPISENALITGDKGICIAAEKRGLNALLISNAGVLLPPYGNGFFGGACGKISAKTLAVNGSLSHMDSGGEIAKFLSEQGISTMEISPAPPFDTGSLIPLMTNVDNRH